MPLQRRTPRRLRLVCPHRNGGGCPMTANQPTRLIRREIYLLVASGGRLIAFSGTEFLAGVRGLKSSSTLLAILRLVRFRHVVASCRAILLNAVYALECVTAVCASLLKGHGYPLISSFIKTLRLCESARGHTHTHTHTHTGTGYHGMLCGNGMK